MAKALSIYGVYSNPMSKINYAMACIAVIALVSLQPAMPQNAEAYLPSPSMQLKAGVPAEEVICGGDRILALRQPGVSACVWEGTAQRLGWQVIATEFAAPDYSGIVNASNGFAMDLYSRLSSERPGDNVLFSPWSIFSAFALVHEGAAGKTAGELSATFGFPDGKAAQFAASPADLNPHGAPYRLSVANALWIDDSGEPAPGYVGVARAGYGSDVFGVDFAAPQTVEQANGWIAEKTGGRIKNILGPDTVDEMTRLLITNAVYFKGWWENTFVEGSTYEDRFWVSANKSVPVQMMTTGEGILVGHAELETAQMIEMKYKGGRISMLVLLPDERDGMGRLESQLDADRLAAWREQLKITKFEIHFPKFDIDARYDLKDTLDGMGISSLFGSSADLSGASAEPLFVSDALHQAFINVHEHGTEAGAATAVSASASGPPAFVANHPFIFVIQDMETGNILFMGRLADPTK